MASREEEREVLDTILARGVDQGWFFRADPAETSAIPQGDLEALYARIAEREDVELTGPDPWETTDPPTKSIEGTHPGWVILTQRCDLVRAYRVEPLVEIARAVLLSDATQVRAARINSARLVFLAEGAEGTCWAADLRHRAVIGKDALISQELTQPIASRDERKGFRLRLGQRYWRDPVPTEVVTTLQRPLRDAFSGSKKRVARGENLEAILGETLDDGTILLIAIVGAGKSREAAESDWGEVMQALKPEARALIHPESEVLTRADISLDQWLHMFKLDLDEVTRSTKATAEQAQPPS